MKIKEWENREKYVSHCSWRISSDCEDKNETKESIENFAKQKNIAKISSGICSACIDLLDIAFD